MVSVLLCFRINSTSAAVQTTCTARAETPTIFQWLMASEWNTSFPPNVAISLQIWPCLLSTAWVFGVLKAQHYSDHQSQVPGSQNPPHSWCRLGCSTQLQSLEGTARAPKWSRSQGREQMKKMGNPTSGSFTQQQQIAVFILDLL